MPRDLYEIAGSDPPSDDWFLCPVCEYPMLKLREYEERGGAGVDDGTGGGVMSRYDIETAFIAYVWSVLCDLVSSAYRTLWVAHLRRAMLVRYPDSLICPKCLHTERYPPKR